jgi:hypothetical protein
MKQYRITSQHFVPEGETGESDAFIDPTELNELKKLAGVPVSEEVGRGAGPVDSMGIETPQASETGITSPVGSNISYTAKERNDLLKKYHVMPGTDLWFLINFSLPKLNGSLEQHVEKYLQAHPEYAPGKMPGE